MKSDRWDKPDQRWWRWKIWE